MVESNNPMDMDYRIPNNTTNNMNATPSSREIATAITGIESNFISGTITIVREKCKTLILKLHTPSYRYYGLGGVIKPEADIDKTIEELGNDLTQNVIGAMNSIRIEVKNARPSESEANYEVKIQIYKDLLEYVTNLFKELTKVFDESLTNYRLRIEQLWDDLQKTSDQSIIDNYMKQFERESEELFANPVQKYLNSYLNAMESNMNSINQS